MAFLADWQINDSPPTLLPQELGSHSLKLQKYLKWSILYLIEIIPGKVFTHDETERIGSLSSDPEPFS